MVVSECLIHLRSARVTSVATVPGGAAVLKLVVVSCAQWPEDEAEAL